jgi:hypothetical protein
VPSAVLDAGQDARVHGQDVAHRQERHEPSTDFRAGRGSQLGDAEEPVKPGKPRKARS